MARPREFEIDKAVEKAAAVFWAKGYEDASMPDLLDGMGLTRGSLYKAFKDKKALFLRVLDHYDQTAVDRAVDLLTDPEIADGRARVRALFKGLVDAVRRGDTRGCLLCTAAAGVEMQDPDIAQAVHAGLARIRDALAEALRASPVHAGQPDAVRHAAANALLTQYIGLRVLARSRLPLGIVENSLSGVEALLWVGPEGTPGG